MRESPVSLVSVVRVTKEEYHPHTNTPTLPHQTQLFTQSPQNRSVHTEAAATLTLTDVNRCDAGDSPPQPSPPRATLTPTQVLITLPLYTTYMVTGMTFSLSNVLVSQLASDNTTLLGTELYFHPYQLDMLGSLMFAGMIVTLAPFGWVVGRFGRRRSLILMTVPAIVSSLIVAISTNTYMILVSRFLLGTAVSLLTVAGRCYFVETSNIRIRGTMMTLVDVFKVLGSLLMVIMGIILPWYYIAVLFTGVMVVMAAFVVLFLPESPTFLALNNKGDEAALVLQTLGVPPTEVEEELRLIKNYNKCHGEKRGSSAMLQIESINKIATISGLVILSAFSGSETIKFNTTRMIQSSGMTFEADVSTILVLAVQLLGCLALTVFIDRLGRRRCLMVAFGLLSATYTVLGFIDMYDLNAELPEVVVIQNLAPLSNSSSSAAYTVPNQRGVSEGLWHWVALAAFMTIAFSTSFGTATVPFLLGVEYFPTSWRPQGVSVYCTVYALASVLTLQLYSIMEDTLTIAGVYWTYALVAALGLVYLPLCVQETKQLYVG